MEETATIKPMKLLSGSIASYDARTTLLDLVLVAEAELPGVPHEEVVIQSPFMVPGAEKATLLMDRNRPDKFIEHDDCREQIVQPQITLSMLLRQARNSPTGDFTKVRVFWSEGRLCMNIKK